MPFNGTGIFNVKFALVPGTTALAEDINTLLTDIASGLSDTLTRDGEAPATANVSMGGFQLTDLASASTPSGAITLAQAGAGIPVANQVITGPAGTTRSLFFQTTLAGGTLSNRFEFQVDGEAEAGSNVGSNMIVNAYADNGTTAVQLAVVTRSTGAVSIKTQWDFISPPTVNSQAIALALTGEIKAWPSVTVPTGYILCNGAAVSRTTFAMLFSVIEATFGAGDGSTTFNLPDLRGVVLRGLDNGRGFDPSRVLGTYQADQLQDHVHSYVIPQYGNSSSGNSASGSPNSANTVTGSVQSANAGVETRAKNVAINYIIKT